MGRNENAFQLDDIRPQSMLAYLENRYKLGEELSKVKKAVPYQCIIIGKSGAGKSTLLNWLNGTKYEEKRSASGNRYLAVLAGSEPGIVQTGDATKSETVLPNVLTVGSNIMVDCPGFFDTRERIVNIGNALNIKQIVTGNVKVLVVVNVNNLYGDRGHFEELLKLRDIFGQGFLNTGSYLIILNKGNEYTYDECISRIEEIMSGQEAYAPIREFMGHIINRIRKVNLLDGESESQYLEVKEPNQYILNAELSHMPRYSGEINVALDPEDQEQVKQMTQGLIGAVKKELLNEGRINHEIILLNYGMLVRLQGLLDNTMRIVDKKISSSFISIQRKITRLVGAGNYVKARELLACLEQLRGALQTDEIGRLFIGKINVVKYYRESREELEKAQAAQNEIEDRKKEVAILKQQQEAEQRERARLEADIKALKEKGTLNDGEVKTLRQQVDQLQKKLIDMVPSGGVVTRDEYARTNALLENAQRELKRLNDERDAHYLEQSFGTAVDKETKSKAAELRGLETRMRELSEAAAEAESKAEVRGAKERVNQAKILLGKRFIGREELERWGIPIRGEVPELPEALANSLEEMCPITGEGQVKDTHILVLNPGLSIQEWQGIIDGKNHRSEHKGEKFYNTESNAWYAKQNETFYREGGEVGWRLILGKPQPGSLDKTYPEMDAMELTAGYTGAGVNDIIVGAFSYYLNSGEKLFQYINSQGVMSTTYTASRYRVYVNFAGGGLFLFGWNGLSHGHSVGRGVLRK